MQHIYLHAIGSAFTLLVYRLCYPFVIRTPQSGFTPAYPIYPVYPAYDSGRYGIATLRCQLLSTLSIAL